MAPRKTHSAVREEALREAVEAIKTKGDESWDLARYMGERGQYRSASDSNDRAVHMYIAADIVKALYEQNEEGEDD